MKRFLSVLLVFATLFSPLAVYAEPTITPIEKGQPAPYDGSLLNNEALAKIMAEKQKAKELCELENKYLKMRSEVDCDLKVNNAKIELDAAKKKYDAVVQIKQEEIERLQKLALKNDNNNHKWWLAGGVIAGVLVTVGAFLLVAQVQKVN
jgi:hypothetical protein